MSMFMEWAWLDFLFSPVEQYHRRLWRALHRTYRLPMPDMGGRPLSISPRDFEEILTMTCWWARLCFESGIELSSDRIAARVKDRLFVLSNENRWLSGEALR